MIQYFFSLHSAFLIGFVPFLNLEITGIDISCVFSIYILIFIHLLHSAFYEQLKVQKHIYLIKLQYKHCFETLYRVKIKKLIKNFIYNSSRAISTHQ